MTKLQLFAKAMENYGMRETLDGVVNPEILRMINNVSQSEIKSNIPWCAAFVNDILKECGFKYSTELVARPMQKLGRVTITPKLGDIAVFWRGNKDGWQGHVGFYVNEINNVVYVLGGNQNNRVCIKAYSKKQLLGYRSVNVKK